jgi:hypothetical protein
MSAPYEAIINITDDETLLFSIEPRTVAGAIPPLDDYTYLYSLQGNGVNMRLTEDDGVDVDAIGGRVTIGPTDRGYRLRPGLYKHGFVMTTIASNVTQQLFDGSVTVTEGNVT